MRKKKPRPCTARVYTSPTMKRVCKRLKQIIHETPLKTKKRISRGISNYEKWCGIRRRILRGQYQPQYINKPKRKDCSNLKYLLERKLYGNGVMYIGG